MSLEFKPLQLLTYTCEGQSPITVRFSEYTSNPEIATCIYQENKIPLPLECLKIKPKDTFKVSYG